MPLSYVYNHYKDWYRRNVQDSGSFKFRIAELGKRIVDVLKVKPIGRNYVYNNQTQKSEKETIYPIRLTEAPIEEKICTPEEKEQIEMELGIKF